MITPIMMLGAGRMGGAILDGWRRARAFPSAELMICDPAPGPSAVAAAEAGARLNPTDADLAQARTGVLDAFFHHYAREAQGRKPFLDWVREDYDPAGLQQEFRANGLASFVNDWVLVHE